MVTGLVVRKAITFDKRTVCILNINVMYFNFTIRLLELENVSSKQLISENDHFQQVAREYYGGVIMKVIVMKLEVT